MTIQHAIGAFRLYGLRGCLDHLKRLLRRSSEISEWRNYLITDKNHQPELGVTIIGSISGAGSLHKVLRDFCVNLKRANVPYQAFDLSCLQCIPNSEFQSLLTPLDKFKLNRYSDIVGMETLPPMPSTRCRLSRIAFWEFESGLREAHSEFGESGTIIANSKFNASVFKKEFSHDVHVHHILYPFQFIASNIAPRNEIRTKYGIAINDFMVFYNFDFNSGYYRKNPEGAARAFAKAFHSHPDAKLVFKTMGAKHKPESVNKLKNAINSLGIGSQVIFIDQFIPQEELVGLTNACDCYLSLHRGEGFGLGIAEAMSLGKPVIATNYSAPTEFCNAENSILIPYKMVNVKDSERDVWQYKYVKTWADPDIDSAAEALSKLYNDREYATELGKKAKASIERQFSIENFKGSMISFLNRKD